jgi:hypothetical protein
MTALFLGIWIWAIAEETQSSSSGEKPLPARPVRVRERFQPRPRVSMSDPNAPLPRPAVQQPRRAANPFEALEARHQETIAELTAILKLAQEENAVKTAEAVQKLIDKQNAEYKQNLSRLQQRQAELQRRLEQRLRERRPTAAESSGSAQENEQKEKTERPNP